ncbi:MAG: hypothetical protein DMG84_11215 [Acidobacteria bacterium]|nr:MAG: hypothetical protein DMG84_11215 [Acidobacteriota bacterium]
MRLENPNVGWASRLIALRRRMGVSQSELGKQLNSSAMAVSRWERGVQEPPANIYIRIAQRRRDARVALRTFAVAERPLARSANCPRRCAQIAQEERSPGSRTSSAGSRGNSRRKGRSGSRSGPDAAGNCVGRAQFMVPQSRLYQLPKSPRPIDDAAAARWLHHRGG